MNKLFILFGLLLSTTFAGWGQNSQHQATNLVFAKPDIPAALPGCAEVTDEQREQCNMMRMREFLTGQLNYPTVARENNIEGEVKIKVLIDTLGQMGNIRIVQKAHPALDEEALRLVQRMKNEGWIWSPAKMKGIKVQSEFNIPVKFLLNKPQFQGPKSKYSDQQ